MEIIEKLGELIENCGTINDYLIKGQMALEDGDIMLSQKYNKNAQGLLKACIGDVFEEVKEVLDCDIAEVNDYDLPIIFELVRQVNLCNQYAGSYLTLLEGESEDIGKNIVKKSLLKSINTVIEINNAIFDN